jgi:transposase
MSLRPTRVPPIPEATARVARLAFRRGNPYLKLRDEFPVLFADAQFADLFPECGQPAAAPWRLALVTLLQFAEGLSDRQAAEAVRSRIDWKYLLSLDLEDTGFDQSLLCEFRARLLAGSAERRLFESLLERFRERRLLKERGKQRTDATHLLAAVRALNRLETVGEALRHTLNVLALVAPDFLIARCPSEWAQQYSERFEQERLPESTAERAALADTIGQHGRLLLGWVWEAASPSFLRELPAVETLRQVWLQQYTPAGDRLRFRTETELPPCPQRLVSPYDPDARYGQKQATAWVGYKLHFTEACEPDAPLLITDVQTSGALTVDSERVPAIQAALAGRDCLPGTHLVDGGYIDARALVQSQAAGVDLVGPAPKDTSWQGRAPAGFAAADFTIRWDEQVVYCPCGERSAAWRETEERGQPVVEVDFAVATCRPCASRPQCTRAIGKGRRLTLRPQAEHRALQEARQREKTAAFRALYAARSGIEGTHSQAVHTCEARRSRYRGQTKTHLQSLLIGAALNLLRVAHWYMKTPRARTRQSAFARLMLCPA